MKVVTIVKPHSIPDNPPVWSYKTGQIGFIRDGAVHTWVPWKVERAVEVGSIAPISEDAELKLQLQKDEDLILSKLNVKLSFK